MPPSLEVIYFFFFFITRRPPTSTLFPYTTLFRSAGQRLFERLDPFLRGGHVAIHPLQVVIAPRVERRDFVDVRVGQRSEEHTSELQSRLHLVCRLLLEKKKKKVS